MVGRRLADERADEAPELRRRLLPVGPSSRGGQRAAAQRLEDVRIGLQTSNRRDHAGFVVGLHDDRVVISHVLLTSGHVVCDSGPATVEHLERRPEHALHLAEFHDHVARPVHGRYGLDRYLLERSVDDVRQTRALPG